MNTNDLETFLKIKADGKTEYEADANFNAYKASGRNIEDAYFMGCSDGEISFARELLTVFFKKENENI